MLGSLFKRFASNDDRNTLAMLSLNLLLLAFFIVLNSMASFEEEKAQAVLDSVNETFSGAAVQKSPMAKFEQSLDVLDEKTVLAKEIGEILDELLELAKIESDVRQTFIKIIIPTRELFIEEEDVFLGGQERLFKELVAALRRYEAKKGFYESDFLYARDEKNPVPEGLALKRLEVMRRAVFDAGLQAELFTMGFNPSKKEEVAILLRLYDDPVEQVTLEEEAD